MIILTFKKVYLIHGKQRLEWLWVFQPWFLPWYVGVTADLKPPLPRRFGLPYQTSFWASFVSYLVTNRCPLSDGLLVTNSIYKIFADVLFHHNTTFLIKDKEKQPFRFNSSAFIIASRALYARIKCEQTTVFELLKLFQKILASSNANQH